MSRRYYPNPTEEYLIKCPKCKKEHVCVPSMEHLLGSYGSGSGICVVCECWMEIIYDSSNNTMSTRIMEPTSQIRGA